MRYAALVLVLGLVGGCNSTLWSRSSSTAPGMRVASANPTGADVVAMLNENAQRVQSIECHDISMDCSQGHDSVGLMGSLVCQPQARNFRMSAKALGSTEVDIGSNSSEFWFWVKRSPQPYLFHCSHEDFARGAAQLPFPFQPDWIIEALGVATYDPNKPYRIEARTGGDFDLVEDGRSPQGQPVRKVTRLSRRTQGQLLVTAHILQDANGREICGAYVQHSQQDAASRVVLPREVVLQWPAQQMRMKLLLDRVVVNSALDQQRLVALFTRPNLQNVQGYDLARGPDSGGLRPAGGTWR